MKNIYVIVATGEWEKDQLTYRRHRLAKFLHRKELTEEVIWLCPSLKKVKHQAIIDNKIKQWCISDIFPKKICAFDRYISLYYQQQLKSLTAYLSSKKEYNNIYLWYTFPCFPLLTKSFEWTKIFYDCSDLWEQRLSGKQSVLSKIRSTIMSRAEKKIISSAHTVFCTSDYLAAHVKQKVPSNSEIYTMENGVEYSLFQEKFILNNTIDTSSYEKTLGFIGGIKPKLDFLMMLRLMKTKPNWLLLLVGPDGTNNDPYFKQLVQEKNVIWTGSVSASEVPAYLGKIDVGIMPYKQSEYNNAVFPLKLFEFLAAGKPVVGSNLPSTLKYDKPQIYTYVESGDDVSFTNACEQMDSQSYVRERKQLAQMKDWDIIFENMLTKAM